MSPKNQLDQIQVPLPCTADWDTMVGNNQVRFCEHCNLSVHNLSAMTRQRALRLAANSRGRLCVRFVHGVDGRPITDLPVKIHHIARRASRFTAGAFTAALSFSSAAAQSPAETMQTVPASEQSATVPEQKPLAPRALSASLTGTITEGRDRPVAGALVKLTSRETGAELITSTTQEGTYSFPALCPGVYSFSARADGYADLDIDRIALFQNADQRRNWVLSADNPKEGDRVEEKFIVTAGMAAVRAPSHPLVAAAYKDDLAAVKELLFKGTDANIFDKFTQTTALEQAVGNGNREMAQLLLFFRADANGGRTRRSALMNLRDNATPELVLDLIAAGALVNQPDEAGDTPLMNAASTSNLAVVKTLIKMGAKVNVSDTAGETPLMRAAANDDPNVIKLLLELGADVNARDEEGETALLLAASSEQPEMIKLLLDAGARVDVSDNDGKTPLLAAAAEENAEVLKLLVDAGGDIEAHDDEGQTALMAAASNAPAELVQLLIDAGAEIDARDNEGQTALMRAVIVGDETSIELLLKAGADFKLKDNEGKTVMGLAREREKAEIVKQLLARGAPE